MSVNRREFLKNSAYAAGALTVGGLGSDENQQDPNKRSFAHLKKVTEGIVPITVAERKGRIESDHALRRKKC